MPATVVDQRIISRLPCSLQLEISAPKTGKTGTVQAQNISMMGLGFRHTLGKRALKKGQQVVLSMTGLNPVNGTVRWVHGDEAGVQFSECLDHVFDSWVVRQISLN